MTFCPRQACMSISVQSITLVWVIECASSQSLVSRARCQWTILFYLDVFSSTSRRISSSFYFIIEDIYRFMFIWWDLWMDNVIIRRVRTHKNCWLYNCGFLYHLYIKVYKITLKRIDCCQPKKGLNVNHQIHFEHYIKTWPLVNCLRYFITSIIFRQCIKQCFLKLSQRIDCKTS